MEDRKRKTEVRRQSDDIDRAVGTGYLKKVIKESSCRARGKEY